MRTIYILTRLYLRETLRTRLAMAALATWMVLLLIGLGLAQVVRRADDARHIREDQALASFYGEIPSYLSFFENFYTVRRPTTPLSSVVAGASYLAPSYADCAPRYAPDLYYGDDVNPLLRMFQPLDLSIAIGVVGLLIAILLCHGAVNGEMERKNGVILLLYSATVRDIFYAKILANSLLIIGSFLAALLLLPAVMMIPYGSGITLPLMSMAIAGSAYLFLSVVCATTLSLVVKKPGVSFVLLIGIALLWIYFIPFGVEHSFNLLKPSQLTASELTERKTRESRRLHAALDEALLRYFINPELANSGEVQRQRIAQAWRERLPTTEELYQARNDEGDPILAFALDNSEDARKQNHDYQVYMKSRNESVTLMAVAASPFFALRHALAVLAKTSFIDEFNVIHAVTDSFYRKYRSWWFRGVTLAPLGTSREFRGPRFLWQSPEGFRHDLLGEPEYPSQDAAEMRRHLSICAMSLICYALFFLLVGRRLAVGFVARGLQ